MGADMNMKRCGVRCCSPDAQRGISMLEVLVTLFIVAIGVLGLAGLQARATNAEFESYQRSQAIILVNDMVERIRTNRVNKGVFKNITTDLINGKPYLGTTGADSYTLTCSPAPNQAMSDLCTWQSLLQGSAETSAAGQVGAMLGARGCIVYDSSTEVAGAPDTGVFTVTVAWQATTNAVAPVETCATGLYGSEAKRRAVSVRFRFAKLS